LTLVGGVFLFGTNQPASYVTVSPWAFAALSATWDTYLGRAATPQPAGAGGSIPFGRPRAPTALAPASAGPRPSPGASRRSASPATVAGVRGGDREELSIPLRRETRAKLEQLARAEGEAAARPITAAELAAAVVEQFVATAANG